MTLITWVQQMRIGEVAVFSPPGNEKEIFIKSICNNVESANERICFGRFLVNEQLSLHLYGISINKNETSISWDMLSSKILGYVFIFRWEDHDSLDTIKDVLDYFAEHYTAPIIVIASVDDKSAIPLPDKFYGPGGLSIDRNIRFHFCQITDSVSSKKIVVNIIDMLLENIQ